MGNGSDPTNTITTPERGCFVSRSIEAMVCDRTTDLHVRKTPAKGGRLARQGYVGQHPKSKTGGLGRGTAGPRREIFEMEGLKQFEARAGGSKMVKSIFETKLLHTVIPPTHLDGVDFFFFATGGATGEPTAPPSSEEPPCPDMDLLSASRRLDMLGETTTPSGLMLQRRKLCLVCSCTENTREDGTTPPLRIQGYYFRKHASTGRSSRMASAERSTLTRGEK